jgi:hypothetical protein
MLPMVANDGGNGKGWKDRNNKRREIQMRGLNEQARLFVEGGGGCDVGGEGEKRAEEKADGISQVTQEEVFRIVPE